METAVVILSVVLAVAYAAWRVRRAFSRHDPCAGCGGCCGCAQKEVCKTE